MRLLIFTILSVFIVYGLAVAYNGYFSSNFNRPLLGCRKMKLGHCPCKRSCGNMSLMKKKTTIN